MSLVTDNPYVCTLISINASQKVPSAPLQLNCYTNWDPKELILKLAVSANLFQVGQQHNLTQFGFLYFHAEIKVPCTSVDNGTADVQDIQETSSELTHLDDGMDPNVFVVRRAMSQVTSGSFGSLSAVLQHTLF